MSAKMSKEAAQKLNRLLWMGLAKKIGAGALALGLVAAFIGYKTTRADHVVAVHEVGGIAAISQPTGRRNVYLVAVHLTDGRNIQATSTTGAPIKGAHVDVSDMAFASGRHVYTVKHTDK